MSNWQYDRNSKRKKPNAAEQTDPAMEYPVRIIVFAALIVLLFTLLAVRLYFLQIESGDENLERVARQSIRRIRIPARRGKILTRDLHLLAGNEPGMKLVIYPEEMRRNRRSRTVSKIFETIEKIALAIGRKNPHSGQTILRHLRLRPGLPLTVFENLSPEETARALEATRMMQGIDFVESEKRHYPEGKLAAHLIGYAREEDPKQATDRREYFYYVSDLIGREGLEKAFDRIPENFGGGPQRINEDVFGLRGLPGYSVSRVDHQGYIREKKLEFVAPKHGNNLVLTLDYRAQKIAESLLLWQKGAVVILDASSGDLLACASAPAMDRSQYSPVLSRSYYRELLADPLQPLLNRACSQIYAPGSILKPLIALAALEKGISPENRIVCDGETVIGNAKVRCAAWRRGGHGELDLERALSLSCNDYLLETGMKTGLPAISQVLQSAGIGRKTGLELPENAGIFPSDFNKQRFHHARWNRYDTALLSMGQGLIGLTPLQAAVYAGALANGGRVMRPHVVHSIVSPAGKVLKERKVEITSCLAASPKNLAIVRHGMFKVVNDPDGSGRLAKVENLNVYGKTGSAEVGVKPNLSLITWFLFFAECKDRTLAGVIMIEDGQSGGRTCAPLAADFLRRYLKTEEKRSFANGTL